MASRSYTIDAASIGDQMEVCSQPLDPHGHLALPYEVGGNVRRHDAWVSQQCAKTMDNQALVPTWRGEHGTLREGARPDVALRSCRQQVCSDIAITSAKSNDTLRRHARCKWDGAAAAAK